MLDPHRSNYCNIAEKKGISTVNLNYERRLFTAYTSLKNYKISYIFQSRMHFSVCTLAQSEPELEH